MTGTAAACTAPEAAVAHAPAAVCRPRGRAAAGATPKRMFRTDSRNVHAGFGSIRRRERTNGATDGVLPIAGSQVRSAVELDSGSCV